MASPGLINLQTDLTSLRYGSDKPYVTKDIGQAPSTQVGRQIQSRIDDTSRIAQMLIDKPGLKFLANQALLQQVNIQDKLQKSRDKGNGNLAGAIVKQGLETVKQTAKIVGSTLAQVPVNGTGTHFVYAFRTDTYLQPSGDTRAFAQFFGAGGVEGAQYALRGENITGKVESKFGTQKDGVFEIDPDLDKDYGYNANVFNGKELKDYDEVRNKPIPEDKFQGKFFSKLGKTVTIDTGSMGPKDPLVKTKLQQSKAGNLTIGTIPVLEAGAPPALGGTTPVYSYENTFTGTSALGATLYAQGGTPIPVVSGSGQRETTATPGSSLVTGIVNTGYTDENTSNPADELGLIVPTTSRDTKEDSYGKNSTDYLNNLASYTPTKSQFWEEGEGIPPTSVSTHLVNQNTARSVNKEVKSSEEKFDTNSAGNKYYAEQQDRKIGDSQKNVVREKRVGLGDQGKRNKSGINYWTNPTDDEIDVINHIDVTTVRPEGAGVGRDLAKFYFEIITPDAKSRFLYFRAFIDSFDDSYTANWQGHKYVGRAENFYTYGGFDRDISVSFKVAAATRAEMKPLYKKMVFLASATAPTYGGMMTKYMRGTFARMTVGSYLDQVPGVITSVKYNLIENMPWEISMGQPEGVEPESQVLPMGMQCTVAFKPIHDFAPQTGLYPYFTNANEEPRYFTEQDAVLT